jgi:hypothetical protein
LIIRVAKFKKFQTMTESDFWGADGAATVEFCEPKYATTPYIFEFYNTVSNVVYLLAAFATLLSLKSLPVTLEKQGKKSRRTCTTRIAPSVCLLAVGISSALLHASGRRWAQLLDEMSMLSWTWSILVSLRDCSRLTVGPAGDEFYLLFSLLTLSAVAAYVLTGVFDVFMLVFSMHVLVVLGVLWDSSRTTSKHKTEEELLVSARSDCWTATMIFVLASLIWGADQQFCPFQGIGHVFWHILTAAACWFVHRAVIVIDCHHSRKSD